MILSADNAPDMKIIPVKMRGKNASLPCKVDDEDYEILRKYKWSSRFGPTLIKPYARTGITNRVLFPNKKQIHIDLHRIIMWCPSHLEIDHIDRNTLNNQKKNLRICTHSQNTMNRINSRNTSGYKGVCKRKNGWYTTTIYSEGKRYYLGTSKKIENCVLAYRLAARILHKDFRSL